MGKVCPQCNGPVLRKCLKYCTKECYAEARRKEVGVSCENCGNLFTIRPFEANRARTHYCPNCRDHWDNRRPADKQPTGYQLHCFFCNAPVYRQRWYSSRYLYTFCSKQCRRAGWRELRLAHEGLFGSKANEETI